MSQRSLENDLKSAFPRFLPWLRDPRRSRIGFYSLSYILVELSFALTVLSLILCLWPAWAWAAFFERLLSPALRPGVMAAVVSLVGLPGVVFAWLISHTEDRVCGVRMSSLIDWAYPNFFSLYFVHFIALSIIAVFAGNVGLFWPTIYAFCGVLIALGVICRVCYQFVVRSDLRENLAFEYYEDFLTRSRDRDEQIKETLLNTADYMRFLLMQERHNSTLRIAELWLKTFPAEQTVPTMDVSTAAYWKEDEDSLIRHSALFRSAWSALLPNGLADPQDTALMCAMLEQLDISSIPKQNEVQQKFLYSRQAILLGLAQFLLELGQKSREWGIEQLNTLSFGRQKSSAVQELVCAYLTMLSVEWTCGAPRARLALFQAAQSMFPVLEECLVKDPNGGRGTPLASFLLHAQWIARRTRQMNAVAYLLKVSQLLEQEILGFGSFLDRTDPMDQKDLLLVLLYLAEWEEEDEMEKRRADDHGKD